MTFDVQWVDGEFTGRSAPSDLEAEVKELVAILKQQPGHWAVIETHEVEDKEKAHRRRYALLKHAPSQLEVTVRWPDVYARWVEDDGHAGADEGGESGEGEPA